MPFSYYFLHGQTLKNIPLQALPDSAWGGDVMVGGSLNDTDIKPFDAFKKVPWLHRAVDLRAKAVASMPYVLYQGTGDTEVTESERYKGILDGLWTRLYRTEAALCLYGGAYWVTDTNRWGLNITPRWVMPTTISPQFDEKKGLTGFTRRLKQYEEYPLKLEQVVYFWMPSLDAEEGPGCPPALVALSAAGVLYNLDRFVEGYFIRGAVRPTLLRVDGNPPPAEKNRIKDAWRRIAGVKKAYEPEVFSKNVTVETFGDTPRETTSNELSQQKREDVSTALGVPHSLLFSNAANYATAMVDYLAFYDGTIVPQCRLIQEAINTQLLKTLGVRLEFQPRKLEAYQESELQKAQALKQLIGNDVTILSQNEARSLLELDPIPGGDWDDSSARKSSGILGYHIENGIVTRNEARESLGLPPENDESDDDVMREVQARLGVAKMAKDAGFSVEPSDELAQQLSRFGLELTAPPPPPPLVIPPSVPTPSTTSLSNEQTPSPTPPTTPTPSGPPESAPPVQAQAAKLQSDILAALARATEEVRLARKALSVSPDE